MAAVDDLTGTVARPEVRPYSAIKKGYTYFAEADVLFAKITPCMQNGKHAIARGLTDGIGFGTTEFHVLRPGPEVTAEWVHSFIRQPWVLHEATRHFTGAVGQQRVPEGFLNDFELPLPPLPEQRRIAGILNEQMQEVEKARKATQAQLEAARTLPSAYLREVFDSEEAKKWPRRKFGDVASIVASQVDPKEQEYGALPHVSAENIESGRCRLLYINSAAHDGMISGKYLFEPEDVLYSKLRPYLRKAMVADFRGVCSADMYPVRVDRNTLDPHFTAWTLVADEFTRYADSESRRARMPKLNRDQLFAWMMPVPSLARQREVAGFLAGEFGSTESTRQRIEAQLETINKLPAALLRKAFSGEV